MKLSAAKNTHYTAILSHGETIIEEYEGNEREKLTVLLLARLETEKVGFKGKIVDNHTGKTLMKCCKSTQD